jgi:hypothetical protein
MKAKTTLILLAVAVIVFSYIYFYDRKQPNTEEAQRQAQHVVNFNRDKIDGLIIQNGDEKIELRRHDKKWRLEGPIKDQADTSLIDNLLMDIESWQKDTTISAKEVDADKNRMNEFGLNKPKLRFKLLGEGAPPEILIGKDAALEGKMYVRFENSKETYVAAQPVRKAIDKKPDDFRDKKLTDLSTAQVSRLVVKSAAGEMELEKKGDHWDVVRPLRARGDEQKIGDLIAQITTARIQQFVADDRGDLHPYGLAEPRGSITLFGENDKQGQMLQIGAVPDKQKDQVYVRYASRGFVYTLPKKVEEVLAARPNDLRDRHLARIDRSILDRITIDSPSKGKTVLARKGENWTIASRSNAPANAAEAGRLIDTIGQEQVAKFVEDVASNLPKYGLDKPQLQLSFSSFASENTAETKAGDHPFATIVFGKTEGEIVYARVNDEPFILGVRRTLLDNINVDPLQWQELAVFALKPEQIHRLDITADKQLSLVRGGNHQWIWAKESGNGAINQTNVQSLLNTLSNLHAVRWIGATTPAHGFDKPTLTLVFTSSPDDKAVHKLVIGAPGGNGMWFAHVDEREGTFLVNAPDLNALKLSLIQAPAASPASGASGPIPSPGAVTSPTPPVVASPVAAPTP